MTLIKRSYSVTIGNFDGLHMGHLNLIRQLLKVAAKTKTVPFIVTFSNDLNSRNRILTDEEKKMLFDSLGIGSVFLDFHKFRKLSGERFIEWLQKTYSASNIIVGKDFRFGFRRQNGVQNLSSFTHGRINIIASEHKCDSGEKISSSDIRSFLLKGAFGMATRLLPFGYFMISVKIRGNGYGAKFGYPTINLRKASCKIYPEGVFRAEISLYYGTLNLSKLTPCLAFIGPKSLGIRAVRGSIEVYVPGVRFKLGAKTKIYLRLTKKIDEVRRFHEPSELFTHITRLVKKNDIYLYKGQN